MTNPGVKHLTPPPRARRVAEQLHTGSDQKTPRCSRHPNADATTQSTVPDHPRTAAARTAWATGPSPATDRSRPGVQHRARRLTSQDADWLPVCSAIAKYSLCVSRENGVRVGLEIGKSALKWRVIGTPRTDLPQRPCCAISCRQFDRVLSVMTAIVGIPAAASGRGHEAVASERLIRKRLLPTPTHATHRPYPSGMPHSQMPNEAPASEVHPLTRPNRSLAPVSAKLSTMAAQGTHYRHTHRHHSKWDSQYNVYNDD